MRGLYIHIPFCLKKCKYCDFNSFAFCNEDKKSYLRALFEQMDRYKGEKVDTVFVGGGTPTSLDAEELLVLLEKIRSTFVISSDAEFTVEMNPKTVDKEKLTIMKENGVNRLSVGVQSFNDDELEKIGRIHTGEDAIETVKLIKEYGFDNFSIDLMSALPGQTMETFRQNLETATSLGTTHISCYSLILEEGTPLYEEYLRGEISIPDEDTEREMYDIAVEFLKENGYERYEVSNFAKAGYQSAHNIKYWQCKEYIGIGLSAHSYIDGVRFSNTDDFDNYIEGDFTKYNEEKLSQNDMMSEFMFMGLRMDCGVSKDEFKNRFGEEIEKIFSAPLIKFKDMGMIEGKDGFYRISDKGIGVSNTIMCEFIL